MQPKWCNNGLYSVLESVQGGTMSFNVTAMRMAVGSVPVRAARAPAAHAVALPCFSGLGVANRLCLHAPGSHPRALCVAALCCNSSS